MADVFKALADPTRRAILDELSERSSQTLFEIRSRLATKHQLGSSRQAISQHLDILERAGLITCEPRGRHKFHKLDTRPLERIVATAGFGRFERRQRAHHADQRARGRPSRRRWGRLSLPCSTTHAEPDPDRAATLTLRRV